jgi:hypothetical protein
METDMAKTFTNIAAQGDFIIIRIDDIPAGVEPYEPEGGASGPQYIVAHSETGHNHTMVADRKVKCIPTEGNQRRGPVPSVLRRRCIPTEIVHQRSFDTHETLLVPPGRYEVRRQREYTPEGFRRAAD